MPRFRVLSQGKITESNEFSHSHLKSLELSNEGSEDVGKARTSSDILN